MVRARLRLCAVEVRDSICQSGGGHGFPPACSGYRQNTVATWCEKLWNYRFRIRYSPESILRTVILVVFRTIVVDGNGDRNVPYANDDGKRWNCNWNWLDNDFNSNERVAASRNWQQVGWSEMLGDLRFNGCLSQPSAEHSADFLQLFGK